MKVLIDMYVIFCCPYIGSGCLIWILLKKIGYWLVIINKSERVKMCLFRDNSVYDWILTIYQFILMMNIVHTQDQIIQLSSPVVRF